jgi:hypothetical protein
MRSALSDCAVLERFGGRPAQDGERDQDGGHQERPAHRQPKPVPVGKGLRADARAGAVLRDRAERGQAERGADLPRAGEQTR